MPSDLTGVSYEDLLGYAALIGSAAFARGEVDNCVAGPGPCKASMDCCSAYCGMARCVEVSPSVTQPPQDIRVGQLSLKVTSYLC